MKKIILSGSSSGIGRAIAQALLGLGYTVIGLARDHNKFDPKNANYMTYLIDFSDISAADQALQVIRKQHDDIDVIIGNAGYGQFGALEQFSTQQIRAMVDVNFLGQVLLVKTFLPTLKRKRQGKIILMGSESALNGAKQGSIYCATKFALRGFSQSLRAECRHSGIPVTLVNPGFVDTPFFNTVSCQPEKAPENAMQPEDIAHAVIDLVELAPHYMVEEINIQPLKPLMRQGVKSRL